ASLPALSMTLVEATARKASFLRTVSRETAVHVTVENRRIEEVTRSWEGEPPHFVTARALAPLPRLIGYALPWLEQGAVAFFHKGVESDAEIAALPATVPVDVLSHPVSGEVGSVIIEVRHRHSKALAAES
ncbi:MAG: class I SAM-dependent methyltransferase, partial [Devosiaceae bacterium]|nr:class I SAM-dependent methyltransferase [Devosiaceae bacterium MH13]